MLDCVTYGQNEPPQVSAACRLANESKYVLLKAPICSQTASNFRQCLTGQSVFVV